MGIKKYFILTEVKDMTVSWNIYNLVWEMCPLSVMSVKWNHSTRSWKKKKNFEDVADLNDFIVTMHPNPHQSIPAKQKTHKLQVAAWRHAFEEQI